MAVEYTNEIEYNDEIAINFAGPYLTAGVQRNL